MGINKTIQSINESKRWSFEKRNKSERPLLQLTKGKQRGTKLTESETNEETLQQR